MVLPTRRSRLERIFHLGLFNLILGSMAEAAPTIHWVGADQNVRIEAEGLDGAQLEKLRALGSDEAAWAKVLAVFVAPLDAGVKESGLARDDRLPPMAGRWSIADGRVRFEPRYPLVRGLRYRAELRTKGQPVQTSIFELPKDSLVASTVVTGVYPRAEVLPENLLKFYVHFSAPMSRGGVYRHVHLRDAAGQPIELAFLELDEELWDREMTRLTLLIDPGRIKRGVRPLEEHGPVFEAGRNYALTVDAEGADAEGRPLRMGFEKRFRAGPPDRTPPEPARWTLQAPRVASRSPLIVEFDEPMDHALTLRMLRVDGVEGDAALESGERRWIFVPDQPWTPGTHRLQVTTTIEDLAGNNIGKAFDVDVFENVQRRLATEFVALEFVVK